jgi:hypothetical protein
MVLDVVVKSCSAKKDIPVTQIKRYFEKNNLVCRGGYSRTKGNAGSLKSGVAAVVRAMIALKFWVSGYASMQSSTGAVGICGAGTSALGKAQVVELPWAGAGQ